jgi:hypothetical protein
MAIRETRAGVKHLFSADSMCLWYSIILQGKNKGNDSCDKKRRRMLLLHKTSMPRCCCYENLFSNCLYFRVKVYQNIHVGTIL